MVSIKISKPPEGFPFPNACKNMWTIVYFEPKGEKKTHVKVVGLGFTDDEESKKLYDFFKKGNEYTLKKWQEKYTKKKEK
jgi:hypothetical protein